MKSTDILIRNEYSPELHLLTFKSKQWASKIGFVNSIRDIGKETFIPIYDENSNPDGPYMFTLNRDALSLILEIIKEDELQYISEFNLS